MKHETLDTQSKRALVKGFFLNSFLTPFFFRRIIEKSVKIF